MLVAAHTWFSDHKLSLNISKTKAMLFGTKQRLSNSGHLDIKYDHDQVETVHKFKYLGVVLDQNLKFNEHIDYVRRKVYAKLKALGRLRPYISKSMSIQLYKSFIIPHFDYADVVYDSMSKQLSQQLQVLQNRCLRICCNSTDYVSTAELHAEVNMPTLDIRRKNHCCNLVYKSIEKSSTPAINSMFTKLNDGSQRSTRSGTTNELLLPRCNLEMTKGSFKFRGASYFNMIPNDIRTVDSYDSFKGRLKCSTCFEK